MKTKRFLALLLTIIMIGGMLPTAFAADTAEPVWDPYFCFVAEAKSGWTTDVTSVEMSAIEKYTDLDSTISTGAWCFIQRIGMEGSLMETEMKNDNPNGTTFRENQKDQLGNNAVILKANIEKSGNYKPLMTFKKYDQLGKLNVYFVPASYADSKWTMASKELDLTKVFGDSGVKLVADPDGWKDVTSAKAEIKTEEYDNVYLGAGEYYVIISLDKGSGDTKHASNRTYFITTGLKLTRQTSFSVSSPKQIVKPGEKITVSAVLSDNRDVPLAADITYDTSSPSVATVDGEGVVTAVSEGEATITATTVYEGATYTGSVKITVEELWDPYYCFNAEASKLWTSGSISMNNGVKEYTDLDSDISTGAWEYVNHKNSAIRGMYPKANGGTTFKVNNTDQDGNNLLGNNAVMLRAKLEKSGNYKPSMIYNKNSTYGKLNVYFVPVAYAASKGWTMDANLDLGVVFNDPGVKLVADPDGWASAAATNVTEAFDNVYLPAGEYYVLLSVVASSETTPDANGSTLFVTQGLKLTRQTSFSVSSPKQTVNPGDTVTVSAVLADGHDKPLTAESITYTASPSSIATVDGDGVVTAVSKGTATVTATAVYGGATYTGSVDITVEPWNPPVSLATSTSIAPNTINIVGGEYTRGETVTASAEPELTVGETTYVFRHWVRGTEDNGEVVSKSASYSFKLMTNTYLTAIYSEKTNDKIVEFYNGNGDYLEAKKVIGTSVELPETPALTGFKFLQWIVGKNGNESIVLDKDNVTADVTYAVAEFGDDETVTFTVAGENEAVVYDTSITRESSDGQEKAWYRNGALVGYGKSYTFNVWANVTSIKEEAITTKAPVVYLDPTAKGTARMIEYDAGDKEIVEVGILFGDGEDMSVESCKYKATSQENGGDDGHGQFTAKPANDSYTTAKGYLIYIDGTEYKVVYSDKG